MYSYFNPNPIKNNRVGDCVVRAISKALNQSWEETYIELAIYGLVYGDIMTSNILWGAYLKHKGFNRDMVSADCPDCYTIEDFAREHPNGTYIIGTGTHAVCLKNGTIFDAWDSTQEQPLYFYFKEE